jgi:prepilin-type N-terminal cleavage/methylation domain-containing protein
MIGNERGMTLVEILVAVVIITVGLTAIATGMQIATSGISQAQQETTATFLAEQRLEDIKAFALSTQAAQGFNNVTAGNFPAEGYSSIQGNTTYRRTTTITSPGADIKVVVVNVFYIPVGVTHSANAERQVALSTVLRRR